MEETRAQCLDIITDPSFVGTYGSHSKKSLPAAQSYDSSQKMSGATHNGFDAQGTPLWLCGHFAAKPYAVMLERLNGGEHTGKNVLFWQTKSQIQPVQAGAKEAVPVCIKIDEFCIKHDGFCSKQ